MTDRTLTIAQNTEGAPMTTKCACPSDCNCHHQGPPRHRTNYCGCKRHEVNSVTMTDRTPSDRAADARIAVEGYDGDLSNPEDLRNAIVDLMADLLHLLSVEGMNVEAAHSMAYGHYKAEHFHD